MPATVKVPPMMAQICKRVRERSVSEISAEGHQACTLLHQEKHTHADTLPEIRISLAALSLMVFRESKRTTCWMMSWITIKVIITCVNLVTLAPLVSR